MSFDKFKQIIRVARNNTCAFNLSETAQILDKDEPSIVQALEESGFSIIGQFEPDKIIDQARKLVGNAKYKRGVKLNDAHDIFDCSSLAIHLYELGGIWLPRRSIQQSYYQLGQEINKTAELKPLDLIFTKSRGINRYIKSPEQGIGHVLIYTGKKDTVIHAANSRKGIVEENASDYIFGNNFQKIKRIIHNPEKWIILSLPQNKLVETSDDIFWLLLYAL